MAECSASFGVLRPLPPARARLCCVRACSLSRLPSDAASPPSPTRRPRPAHRALCCARARVRLRPLPLLLLAACLLLLWLRCLALPARCALPAARSCPLPSTTTRSPPLARAAPSPRLTCVYCGCTQCCIGNGGHEGARRSGRASCTRPRPRLILPQVPQWQAAAVAMAGGGQGPGKGTGGNMAGRKRRRPRLAGAPRVAARQATAAGSSAPGGSVRACGVRLPLLRARAILYCTGLYPSLYILVCVVLEVYPRVTHF